MSVDNKPYTLDGISRESFNRNFGSYGGEYVSNDTVTPPSGYSIVRIYTLSEGAVTAVGNITGLTGVTIPADRNINGIFISVTIAATAIVYYGRSQT